MEQEKQELQDVQEPENTEAVGEDTGLHFQYHVTADEVYAALNKVDVLSGAAKKNRAVFGMLLIIVALYIITFFKDKNGIPLVMAAIFSFLALSIRRHAMKSNADLAKSFEEDPEQVVDVQWTQIQLGERSLAYKDINAMYRFRESITIRHGENHYYVMPLRIFEEGQLEEFESQMKAQLGDRYQDHSHKL